MYYILITCTKECFLIVIPYTKLEPPSQCIACTKCLRQCLLASFPGLPRLQFLITCRLVCKNKDWSHGRPGNEAGICSID